MAQNVIINGVTYSDVPEVNIPKVGGGTAKFHDTAADDVTNKDVRDGVKFHGASGEDIGTMPEISGSTDNITTKDQKVTIPEGHHSGEGAVQIAASEQAKIIAGNIKDGVTILGQTGSKMVQDTTVASNGASAFQILKNYKAWVNGQLVDGAMTAATVAQDSSTKVLSIS